MSEKEKMLNSELYNSLEDNELVKERETAKELCFKYNNLSPSQVKKRNKILKELLGQCGEKFVVEQPFMCDYGYNIELGENFYSNHNLIILDCAKVKFGNNVLVGPNCAFYTPEHPIDVEKRISGLEYAKPITIGNNVWFGGNVVVLSGVTIGDNSIIGAGSIVTKDIPSNCIALGNPCKVIKNL